MKTFYEFVLTYRGAAGEKGKFAEAVFNDSLFPRSSQDFHELSEYVETQGETDMNTAVFDEIWGDYTSKYSL